MTGRPAGQHEWEATFGHDELGRPVPPRHHILVLADVVGRPGADAARQLEDGLAGLEQRHRHGPDGLLSTVGWGHAWFDGHTAHRGLISVPARMSRWEDPVLDRPDALFHLASDHEDVLDGTYDALFGTAGTSQREHLVVREVRRGFVGAGLPAQALPELGIPVTSPLLFGFHSIHRGNQATEASITIGSGPLAGGTTAHVSRIELDVERWHGQDRDAQAALLYAPTVTARQAEAFGDDAPSDYQRYEQTVRAHGIVGHAQAAARARVNNVPIINRRDFATVDDGKPGTHFVSLQRELRDFNNTRAIMNGADGTGYHGAVGTRRRNGINAFFDVTHRATFGLPPRALRAYPHRSSSR
ncbi:MAG: Tat pathway signal protein [Actinobacteria bacterium]|nr:Tat pathway signal protein [Actinomycetota bacterium]